jgi:hypothetical protein
MQVRLAQPGARGDHCGASLGVLDSLLKHEDFLGREDLDRVTNRFEIVQQPHVRRIEVSSDSGSFDLPADVRQFCAVVHDRPGDAERGRSNLTGRLRLAQEGIEELGERRDRRRLIASSDERNGPPGTRLEQSQ